MTLSYLKKSIKGLVIGSLFILVSFGGYASSIEGDWGATLKVNESVELPLIVHLKNKAGKWQGTLDTPAQGSFGIPMTQVEVTKNRLIFDISSLQIHYEGVFDQRNDVIEGTFVQGKLFDLNFIRQKEVAAEYANTSDVDAVLGKWSGQLQTPVGPLAFVLEVEQKDGKFTARAQSPDQSSQYIPINTFEFNNGKVIFTIDGLNVRFEGGLRKDKKAISGDFTQGSAVMKLSLDREPIEKKLSARPQTPQPPFEYVVEEVKVVNSKVNITLAGTLTKPNGLVKATAVMITGSGPQDRDESIMRHKPFAVIADHLAKRGFSVLRLDDRGFGKSTGNFKTATSEDFASDINAAVDYLKSRDDIPSNTIGLIGHSEGGMIAPMVASQRDDLAFVIMMAGPGIDIVDLYVEQRSSIFKSMGVQQEKLSKIKQLDMMIFEQINQIPDDGVIAEETIQLMRKISRMVGVQVEAEIDSQVNVLAETYMTPWFRYFLKFDPEPYIKKMKMPILALNGSLDIQVDAKQNLNGIRNALADINHDDSQVVELERLNHLFQTAETGSISEYNNIEETIAPEALNLISDWLDERFAE